MPAGFSLDAAHPVGVHQHIVEIPEIDVGQVFGDDALNFVIDDFALLLVERAAAFADQLVDPRVRVEGAVGALGREAGGVEDVFEDVGVLVAANPAHGIHLVGALGDVAEESRKLVRCECRARFPPRGVAVAAPPPSTASIRRSRTSSRCESGRRSSAWYPASSRIWRARRGS